MGCLGRLGGMDGELELVALARRSCENGATVELNSTVHVSRPSRSFYHNSVFCNFCHLPPARPSWCPAASASKAFSANLNTRCGGTIALGVIVEGGLTLLMSQVFPLIEASLQCLERYTDVDCLCEWVKECISKQSSWRSLSTPRHSPSHARRLMG